MSVMGPGPQAPKEILEMMPDGMQPMDAVETWQQGFIDGSEKKDFRLILDEGILDIYERGYEDGKKHREIRQSLGKDTFLKEMRDASAPTPPEEVPFGYKVRAFFYYYEGALLLSIKAVEAGILAGIAAGLWRNRR